MAGGKPIHPATVHFPIAFLTLAFGLDIFTAAGSNIPSAITSLLPPTFDLHRASYYLLSLGLVTAVPAVLSGATQAFAMISKQGIYEADKKTIKPKVLTTVTHAALNDVVLGIAGYIWYARREAITGSLAQKLGGIETAAAYAPQTWMVGTEAILTLAFMYAASLGGALTYNYGVGFQSLPAEKKKQ